MFTQQDFLRLDVTQSITADTSALTFHGDDNSYLIHNKSDNTVFLNFGETSTLTAAGDNATSMELEAGERMTVIINFMSYYAAAPSILKLTEVMNVG